jgi:ABC-type glutathione transport system ATPase component
MPSDSDDILVVDDLQGGFGNPVRNVLHGVSLRVARGSLTAIVGETGSGKTLTALSVMGLAPRGFRRTAGTITFDGLDITRLDTAALRQLRGAGVAIVFQDARAALNPVFTIGRQLRDVLRLHQHLDRGAARSSAQALLEQVQMTEAPRRMRQYPHELSGGMAQRAQLALALACRPRLLLLDEPTTGLDVTIQADILDLIVELNRTSGMTTCMITHDLGVVAETCDDVIVLRHGRTVEASTCAEFFTEPKDPYTRTLLASSRLDRLML